ncbi:MAG: sugar phosphate isomerase/epimerase [Turicibacter sp.]|nr:sugar phosphate isomerase/epimerase [Turicibacter sp.]
MIKLGLVSAILGHKNFEETIDFLAANDLETVELACWPAGKAERRYAGVSHLDVDGLTKVKADAALAYASAKGIEISSLGYYPNFLDPDVSKREVYVNHFYKLIDASALMGINLVTTFIGRDQHKTVAENLDLMEEVWTPILAHAEAKNVRIGIENCPMLFTADEWPGGQNLMTTPSIWRQVFERFPSPMLGLNYDPSHFVWQKIDYIKPIYEFKDKLFHVHYKDIKLYEDKLADVGVMATPLAYMSPKIPGLGDVDWGKFVSALTDVGYTGYSAIEVEDKAFEKTEADVEKSIQLSVKYLRNFV